MKKTTLISIFIRIAIFIAVLLYLDVDFTELKKMFSDATNQTFLVIMALSLVLDLLKNLVKLKSFVYLNKNNDYKNEIKRTN